MNKTTLYSNDEGIHNKGTDSERVGRNTRSTGLVTLNIASWLALNAVAGPILFTLAWLILGFVSPGFTLWDIEVAPYSPISHPISGLGLGLTAPYMNAAFVIGGVLIMIGAAGIFRSFQELSAAARWIFTLLLGLTGFGMMLSGIFTLETILPHTAGFLLGTGTPVLSFLVIGAYFRRIPSWRRFASWLLLFSPLTLVFLITSMVTFDPVAAGAGLGITGLVQRILVSEILGLIAVMGWKAFRHANH